MIDNVVVTRWYQTHTKSSTSPSATIVPTVVGAISLCALIYLFSNAPLQISRGNRQSNPRFFNKWAVLFLDSALCALWFVAWVQEAAFRASLNLCFAQICSMMSAAAALGAING